MFMASLLMESISPSMAYLDGLWGTRTVVSMMIFVARLWMPLVGYWAIVSSYTKVACVVAGAM